MRVADLIRQKREGGEIAPEQINFLIEGYTRGQIPDYQVSALLMAIVWRGMTHSEIAALTDAMLRSGRTLDLSDLPGKKVDKHSTGGVGDKTSLVIAPIAAAGGIRNLNTALALLRAGADRLGASQSVSILKEFQQVYVEQSSRS